MEQILMILGEVVFIAYIVLTSFKFGLLDSISNSWYKWTEYGMKKGKPYLGLYFSIWCCLVCMLIIHPGIVSTEGTYAEYFVLPMCMGLLTVGAAPMYANSRFKKWHIRGAILAAVFAQLITFSQGMILSSLIILAGCFAVQKLTIKKDTVLWLEIGCFISYFIATHTNI